MIASITSEIVLGGGLTLVNLLIGLGIVLVVNHLLRGQPV
jgi:hypothetical protein